nr:hypothetical protein CFP56_74437 [Quercus suber]
MDGENIENITSQTAKLGWLKNKLNLDVDPSAQEESNRLLIGKILSKKVFPKPLVKEILTKAWNIVNDIEVSVADKNVFIFSFAHEAELRRAWDRRPWTMKGDPLILKRFNSDLSIAEVDFSTTEFWIQVHGLSLNRVSTENLLKIGSLVGRALDTDAVSPGQGIWREVLKCGMLGHDLRDCLGSGLQLMGRDREVTRMYGKWLRADNNEFQPGLNIEQLLHSDRTECSPSSTRWQRDLDGRLAMPKMAKRPIEVQGGEFEPCDAGFGSINQGESSEVVQESDKNGTNDVTGALTKSLHGRGGRPYHAPQFAMRTLAWNCRGAGRAPTVRSLRSLILNSNPDLVFLSEMKITALRVEKIRVKLNFVDSFCVDANGRSGGLAILWRQGMELEVVYSSRYVIASLIYSDPPRSPWLFFFVYGPSYRVKRKQF